MCNDSVMINERLTLKGSRYGQAFSADSFLLAALTEKTDKAAVDLGSGTGVCSLILADRNKAEFIYAVELQNELFETAVFNIAENKLNNKITAIHADIRTLKKSDFDREIGLVIANPPYFRSNEGKKSPNPLKNAARFELNGTLEDFVAAAAGIISDNGRFCCIIKPDREDELMSYIEKHGLVPIRSVYISHTKNASPSMVFSEAGHGEHSHIKTYLPLYESDGSESQEAKSIYSYPENL